MLACGVFCFDVLLCFVCRIEDILGSIQNLLAAHYGEDLLLERILNMSSGDRALDIADSCLDSLDVR